MKFILCFVLLISEFFLLANIIEVIQDGSGNHTNISDAMEEAVDGDTVLVYPGTYYEYVNYDSKMVVLGSLYMTTGDREYIHDTIIDGGGERGCVVVHFGEPEGTKLIGFTLQHGNGWVLPNSLMAVGGALNISNGNIIIDNCVIKENKAMIGGGLFIGFDCTVELKGCTIRKNWAMIEGGGIGFANGNNSIIFNETDRCSIYNNRSGLGSDICSKYEGGEVAVYLDTITCEEYSGYYAVQYDYLDGPGIIWDGFTIETENYWMEQTDADLFAAPWGNDDNSGLSAYDPLKSVTWASYLIAANEDDPHTIHLAPGVYSQGETGEVFPFQPKSYVTIKGETAENTIIDGEHNTSFIYLNYSWGDIHLEDIKFVNSGKSEQFSFFSITKFPLKFNPNILADLYLENLIFENNWCKIMMLIETHANVYMNNILVNNNYIDDTNCDIRLTVYNNEEQTEIVCQNITMHDNYDCVFHLLGRQSIPKFIFNNISMYHNTKISDSNDIYNYSSFWIAFPMEVFLINSSIGNNFVDISSPSGVVQMSDHANLTLINSVIYGNDTDYFVLDYNESGSELNIYNSLFDYSEENIKSFGWMEMNWNDATIFEGDPMFIGNESCPLSLMNGSPCIDAGTQEYMPDFQATAYDAAGNPRIYGNGIDMGAYEWQGTDIDQEEIISKPDEIIIYPNPLIAGTLRDGQANISWTGENLTDNASIEIFNIKGQRLRKIIISSGKNGIIWDGKDDKGNFLSSGVYFIRLKAGEDYVSQQKVTVVK